MLDVLVKSALSKKRTWFFGRKLAPKKPANARRALGARMDVGAGAAGDEGACRSRSAITDSAVQNAIRSRGTVSSAPSSPVKFLSSLAQSLSTMMLYPREHPTWGRAVDASFQHLVELQTENPFPQFSFIGTDVIYGQAPMHDMKDWPWAEKLAGVGVQRLEFGAGVDRGGVRGISSRMC